MPCIRSPGSLTKRYIKYDACVPFGMKAKNVSLMARAAVVVAVCLLFSWIYL